MTDSLPSTDRELGMPDNTRGTKRRVRTPTYISWFSMRARTSYPKHKAFKNYGGRGIKCCEQWATFKGFLADMGERPVGTTLDRFPNNDGHYEPGNCRWATRKQQAANKRRAAVRS